MEHMDPVFLYYCVRAGFKRGLEEEKKASRRKPRRKAPPRRLCYKCRSPEHLAATCDSDIKSDTNSDKSNAIDNPSSKSICEMEKKIIELENKISILGSKLDSELKVSEDSKPSEMEKSEPKTSLSREETLKSEMMEWSMEKWRPFQIEPSIPFANNEIVNYRDPKFSMFRTSWEDKRIRFGPFMWKLW